MRSPPPELRKFLKAYDPAIGRLFFAARKAVLAAEPAANELVYDAYNAVAAAYSLSDRMKDAFCHVAAYRDYVNLGFNRGATLADPEKLLAGTGKLIRHIRVSQANVLERPAVRMLIRAAVEQGRALSTQVATGPRKQTLVKGNYAKKRRPAATTKRPAAKKATRAPAAGKRK